MAPSFARMGFTTRIYDNPLPGQGPVLLATRIEDARLPTVLGYGHGDVIRGLEDQWTKGKGPWVTARDGDRVYGRGTADNKGQHTLNMAILERVREERGGKLGFNVKFIIETGEEAGSKGLAELVAAHKADFAADVLIASDGPRVRPERPTITLGCRGAINFDLVCDLREGGHHSGNWGGLIANPGVILAHALATIVGPTGELLVPALKAPPMTKAVKDSLADVEVDGGECGPAVDAWWGDAGLTPAERVYASNVFNILAFTTGTPGRPVNAIPPKAVANCQLRFVAGTVGRRRRARSAAPSRRERLHHRQGHAAARRQRRTLRGNAHGARSPLGGVRRAIAAALGQRQAGGGAADGRLDLQRHLHGYPGHPHHLGAALLPGLLAARARRAHPAQRLPLRRGGHGWALLGHRRGQGAGCPILRPRRLSGRWRCNP